MSSTWIDNGDGTGICCDADVDKNLIRLKLKKPQAWKWELTTSRSSPNIALPRIMLFNHMGDLLVDANRQANDTVYKEEKRAPKLPKRRVRRLHKAATTDLERALQEDEDTGLGSLDSMEKQSYKNQRRNSLHQSRQSSIKYKDLPDVQEDPHVFEKVNGCKAWRNSAPDEIDFEKLQIYEATESDQSYRRSPRKSPIKIVEKSSSQAEEDENIDTPWRRKMGHAEKSIEPTITTCNDLDNSPDRLFISRASWKPFLSNGHLDAPSPTFKPFERRASSFKEVRFNVHPPSDEESEQKPRVKRRYRRSNTNDQSLALSGSILERLSAMKCRFSSPEFDTIQTHQVQTGPRYFLRTSRAGTLVVAEENLKHRRMRRKPAKTSSAETIQSPPSLKATSSFKQGEFLAPGLGAPCSQSQSMNNFAEMNGNRSRRKGTPIRRHKSDGNIILATSSEDEKDRNQEKNRGFARHRRNRPWQLSREDATNAAKQCA